MQFPAADFNTERVRFNFIEAEKDSYIPFMFPVFFDPDDDVPFVTFPVGVVGHEVQIFGSIVINPLVPGADPAGHSPSGIHSRRCLSLRGGSRIRGRDHIRRHGRAEGGGSHRTKL